MALPMHAVIQKLYTDRLPPLRMLRLKLDEGRPPSGMPYVAAIDQADMKESVLL